MNQATTQPFSQSNDQADPATNPQIHQSINQSNGESWHGMTQKNCTQLTVELTLKTCVAQGWSRHVYLHMYTQVLWTKTPHWFRLKDIDADLIAWNPPTKTRQFMWISVDCLKDHWITEACGWIVEHSMEPLKRIWPCQQEQESLWHARSGTVGVLACFGFLFQERKPGTPFF